MAGYTTPRLIVISLSPCRARIELSSSAGDQVAGTGVARDQRITQRLAAPLEPTRLWIVFGDNEQGPSAGREGRYGPGRAEVSFRPGTDRCRRGNGSNTPVVLGKPLVRFRAGPGAFNVSNLAYLDIHC